MTQEYAGLKFDDTLVCDYPERHLQDSKIKAVKIEDLLEQGIDLRQHHLPLGCVIQLKFHTAIEFIKKWIRELRLHHPDKDAVPLTPGYDSAHADVYTALTNYETPQHEKLSSPPQYGGLICSASRSDLQFLIGCILHMLYEEKYITGYGRKGSTFWVFL